MGTDYETMRMLCSAKRPSYPAVIEQTTQGDYGFLTGAIPAELQGIRYKTAGEAVYALLRSEAVKTGKIIHFQVQEDGHISKPYRKVSADKWAKDDGGGVYVATMPS